MMMQNMIFNNTWCNIVKLCNLCVTYLTILQTLSVYIYITITIYIYTQLHRYTNKTTLYNYTNKHIFESIILFFEQLEKIINSYVYTGKREKRCNCVTFTLKRIQTTLCTVTFIVMVSPGVGLSLESSMSSSLISRSVNM